VRLSTRAIRTVEKRGGIDAYLLSASETELGSKARELRRRIKKAAEKQQGATA
jgi:large subunit ribosomal protein L28